MLAHCVRAQLWRFSLRGIGGLLWSVLKKMSGTARAPISGCRTTKGSIDRLCVSFFLQSYMALKRAVQLGDYFQDFSQPSQVAVVSFKSAGPKRCPKDKNKDVIRFQFQVNDYLTSDMDHKSCRLHRVLPSCGHTHTARRVSERILAKAVESAHKERLLGTTPTDSPDDSGNPALRSLQRSAHLSRSPEPFQSSHFPPSKDLRSIRCKPTLVSSPNLWFLSRASS